MSACKKHRLDPVRGYHECPGCEIEALQAEARELRAKLAETSKLRSLLHTFAVNVNSLGALDAASQLILDMKAFAARSQPAEPAQRKGS